MLFSYPACDNEYNTNDLPNNPFLTKTRVCYTDVKVRWNLFSFQEKWRTSEYVFTRY